MKLIIFVFLSIQGIHLNASAPIDIPPICNDTNKELYDVLKSICSLVEEVNYITQKLNENVPYVTPPIDWLPTPNDLIPTELNTIESLIEPTNELPFEYEAIINFENAPI